jgi:hypothetical protein
LPASLAKSHTQWACVQCVCVCVCVYVCVYVCSLCYILKMEETFDSSPIPTLLKLKNSTKLNNFFEHVQQWQGRITLLTFSLLMCRIGRAPNSILIYSYIQQDATLHSLCISGNCSTYFGWYFHPSSGAHTAVSTASGICHNTGLLS